MARSTHLEKLVTDQLNTRISNLENGVSVIDDNAVDNAALADMAAGTVKGNLGGSTADPTDVTLADLAAALIADTETGNDDLWSAQKIANEISLASASSLKYKGGYDAAANSPDLDSAPTGVVTGFTYTVTTNGDFFGEAVQIGDFIIAEVDDPDTLDDWTIVNSNIGEASTTTKGLVELATNGEAAAGVVVQGNDSRLTDSRTPTGTAGGDLSGTYPNPELGTGVVEGINIANESITLNKLVNTPSQTLVGNNTGGSSTPAFLTPGQVRAMLNIEDNASGDQLASEVSITPALTGILATDVASALSELNTDIETNDTEIATLQTKVTDLETDVHAKAVSGNAGIIIDATTQAVSAVVSTTTNNKLSLDVNGLFVNQTATDVSFTDTDAELGSTNVQGAINELAKDAYSSKIARVSVAGPYTFPAKGPKYQHFVVSADVTGTLPSTPVDGQHYVIKNSASSTNTITVNSVPIVPGDIYEIIYDGTEWVEY